MKTSKFFSLKLEGIELGYLICSTLEATSTKFFLAHLITKCSVSYCDHSLSVGVHLSVHIFLVYTLASTNINQSVQNLVRMYVTTRSRMSSIMDVIRPELSKLSALELENLPYLTLFTISICKYKSISTKFGLNKYDHKISDEFYIIEPKCLELFALELGKIAELTLFSLKHLQI